MIRLRIRGFLEPGDACHVAVAPILDREPPDPHGHDFMEFFLIVEGAGWHFINGRKLPLSAGDLVLIRRKDWHNFAVRGGERMRLLNVAFPCDWFSRLRAVLPKSTVLTQWLSAAMPPTTQLSTVRREALEQRGLDLLVSKTPRHAALASFCLEAIRLLENRVESGQGGAVPEWLATWATTMNTSANLRQSLGWFQQRAGRSAEHLARECRRHFDAPPSELLNQARIRHAKRRLLESDAKVIDVAFDCGFQNLGYFHRTFLRLAESTPRQWRLKNQALTVPQ
jgi:AraC family cel operon transcriptional repressor